MEIVCHCGHAWGCTWGPRVLWDQTATGEEDCNPPLNSLVSYDSGVWSEQSTFVSFCVRWAGDNEKKEGRLRATEQSSAFKFPSEDMEQSSACLDSFRLHGAPCKPTLVFWYQSNISWQC